MKFQTFAPDPNPQIIAFYSETSFDLSTYTGSQFLVACNAGAAYGDVIFEN